MSKYGFACFHFKGEETIEDGFLIREIKLNVGEEKSNQKFKIPQELIIEIPQTVKIVDTAYFSIYSIPLSVEIIKLLSERAGWNQTKADIDAMINNGKEGVFIASYNDKIPLGSGVSFPVSDDLCWIGMILVHPELRRQGIARSIMKACIEHARLTQNKSIVGLDATPLGKQVYDALGFKDSFTIWRSIIQTDIKAKRIPGARIETLNTGSIKNYLEKKNFTERLKIIELLSVLPGSKNIMIVLDDEIQGFVLSRPGRLKPFIGPLIANSNEVALHLMQEILNYWKESGYEYVLMDIPEWHLKNSIFYHDEKSSHLKNHKIPATPVRSFIRMYQLVSHGELPEKSIDLAMKKAHDCHEETAAFIQKEKREIVPIMFGTSGPEWS